MTIFNQKFVLPTSLMILLLYFFRFFINTLFPGVVGCIDCTHVAIIPPNNQNAEIPEYIYVNRKGYHSLNVQLVNVLRFRQ